jgi:hypothetical protein
MAKVKLSEPQRKLLAKAVADGSTFAVDSYPPVKKLLALGYIERASETSLRWRATEAGWKALSDGYIRIELDEAQSEGRKTSVWRVIANDGDILLGEVQWFGRWRGYVFHPEPMTVFEQKCLREIATFVESKSKNHRKGWRRKGLHRVRGSG